jgi:hypothetical protein
VEPAKGGLGPTIVAEWAAGFALWIRQQQMLIVAHHRIARDDPTVRTDDRNFVQLAPFICFASSDGTASATLSLVRVLIRLKSTRDGCDWTRSSARQVLRGGHPHIANMSAPHNLAIAFERSTLKAR